MDHWITNGVQRHDLGPLFERWSRIHVNPRACCSRFPKVSFLTTIDIDAEGHTVIGCCLIRFFTFLLLIHIIVQVSALYKCAKTGDVYSIHCAGNSWFGELFLHLPTTSKIPAPTHPAAADRRVRCRPSTTAPEYPLGTLFERSEAVTTIRSWMAKLTWTWWLDFCILVQLILPPHREFDFKI